MTQITFPEYKNNLITSANKLVEALAATEEKIKDAESILLQMQGALLYERQYYRQLSELTQLCSDNPQAFIQYINYIPVNAFDSLLDVDSAHRVSRATTANICINGREYERALLQHNILRNKLIQICSDPVFATKAPVSMPLPKEDNYALVELSSDLLAVMPEQTAMTQQLAQTLAHNFDQLSTVTASYISNIMKHNPDCVAGKAFLEAYQEPIPQFKSSNIDQNDSSVFHTRLAGVTFVNSDGTDRQANLKHVYEQAQKPELQVEMYDYQGSPAFKVSTDTGAELGVLPADLSAYAVSKSATGHPKLVITKYNVEAPVKDGASYSCRCDIKQNDMSR